jgi:TPR repeat protein
MSVIKSDLDLSNVFGDYVYESYKTAVEFIKIHPDYSLLKFRDVLSALVNAVADSSRMKISTQKLYDQIDYLHECQIISRPLKNALHKVRLLGNRGVHTDVSSNLDSEFVEERKIDLIEKAGQARDLMIGVFEDLFLLFNRDESLPKITKLEIKSQEYKDIVFEALLSEKKQDKLQAGIILEKLAVDSSPDQIVVVSKAFSYHYESLYKISATFYEAAYKISANIDGRIKTLMLNEDIGDLEVITQNYGDLEPLFRFAALMSEGHLGDERKASGYDLMKVSADRGYAPAQAFYGAYSYFESRFEDAISYLKEAEKQDEPLALRFLFKYFAEGKACQSDVNKALEYVNRGVKIGCPDCIAELGEAYHKGLGVQKNDEKAEKLLVEAIDAGSVIARVYYTVEFNDLVGHMTDYFYELGQQFKKSVKASKRQPEKMTKKVGANDLCPCGSEMKYKKCCRDKPAEFFFNSL